MNSTSALILNVNEDAASRGITSRALRLAGFRVVEAASGNEALALANEETDLVILDVWLPDISGLEVCQRLKAETRTQEVRVLHLSAPSVGPGERARGMVPGADGYLRAPVEPEELVAQVHALLRLRQAEREVRALSREVERQRQLLELSLSWAANPLVLHDGTGRVLLASPSLSTARGGRGVLAQGKTLDAMLAEAPALLPYIERVRAALRTGEAERGTVTLETNRGPRPFDFVLSPTRGARGEVLAVLSSMRDVTEARGAEEFREQFIGMLGHDLRNPLNALSMSAQQLRRKGGLDERQRMLTERILSSADRMDRMIRQLLDFARSGLGGGIPVVRAPGDVFEVVRRTVDALRATHPGRVVLLEARGDGRGTWDSDRLEQAVGNVVGNALKYSPAESTVWVGAEGSEREVVLRIHNHGTPISAEDLPHVFRAWRRGRRAAGEASTPSGLGLGLYITRQIVRAHDGDAQVASSATDGTTFLIRLPR